MKEEICNKCQKQMRFLGNISGVVYMSYPAQWDETYVCDDCKEKKVVRCRGALPTDYSFVDTYKEQN